MLPPSFLQDVVGGRLLPRLAGDSSAGDAPASGREALVRCTAGLRTQEGRCALRRTERRAGLSHTLPGEGRRVLAADSSAAPGSMSGRLSSSPPFGEPRTTRIAVPDP